MTDDQDLGLREAFEYPKHNMPKFYQTRVLNANSSKLA